MEIGDEEQEALFHLLSVIIHLGNVEYASGEGGRASISNPALVSTIAKVCIKFLYCCFVWKERKKKKTSILKLGHLENKKLLFYIMH